VSAGREPEFASGISKHYDRTEFDLTVQFHQKFKKYWPTVTVVNRFP